MNTTKSKLNSAKWLFASLFLLATSSVKAQLSGAYAVPGTYTSIASAISDLNIYGVTGPVTINIASGYTETAPVGGYTLNAIVGSSSVNQITFQKSGVGANPLITAFTGTATPSSLTQDGIWRFIGSDFITINGIDLFDPNTTVPATMEFGYGFCKVSATNGCQNNTIRNCVITMNRVNNALGAGPALEGCKGIEMVNATSSAHTTNLTITAVSGANSNNRFYANTIQNCNIGISIIGFSAASPFNLADFNNDIGGFSALTGNTIINFGGGGTNASNGIVTLAQYNLNVSFNTLNNNNGTGLNHNGVIRGIFLNTATSANGSAISNTITINGGGTTQTIFGINNASGSTASNNTINLNNNVIVNCSYTTATSGVFNAILNSATPSTLNMNGNIINNHNLGGTGLHVLMVAGSPIVAAMNSNTVSNIFRNGLSGTLRLLAWTSPQVISVNNNIVNNISWTAVTSTGAVDCLYGLSSAINVTANNNEIYNISVPTTGVINGIREFGTTGVKTFTGNQIYNFSVTTGGAGGATMNGIFCSTGFITVLSNSIYSLQSIGTTGGTGGSVYGIQISGGTSAILSKNKLFNLASNATSPVVGGILVAGSNCLVSNNLIGSLATPSANAVNPLLGINVTAGTTHTIVNNTVNLSGLSSGLNFGSSAFNLATTAAIVLVRNNVFVNTSTPNGTGLTVAFRKSSTIFTNYATGSDNNLFWAGTPSANSLIHFDGTTSFQTMASFKTLAAPRDFGSVTENPPFISLIGLSTNFLNLNTGVPTQIESGGLPVAAVPDDYSGTVRNTNFPDIGAWEGNYTLGLLPTIPPILLSSGFITNQCNTSLRTFTANLVDPFGVGTGTASPRVYYRIGVGTYSSVPGTLSVGTASTGVWTFNLTYSGALNNVISHYLVAQDAAAVPNLAAYPGAGFSGTDVNNITTDPTSPNTYTIANSLGGTYTVGASGTFTSITDAAFAYNNSCLTNSVTFILADATYSNEVLPITFSNNIDASSTNSLLIRPATGVAVTINGTNTAAPAIIKFFNSRFMNIDGINSGGSSLTINNISTATSANIWLSSAGTIGTKSISIRNTNINGGSISAGNGIVSSIDGASPSATGGADNDNVIIQGNNFQTLFNGILAIGATAVSGGGLDGWSISNNIIGPATGPGTNVIGGSGILLSNALGVAITSNTVRNIYTSSSNVYAININSAVNGFTIAQNTATNLISGASSSGVSAIAGIFLGTNAINGWILSNQLSVISNTSTSGYGARGLIVNTGNSTSNLNIRNNFIAGISSYADASVSWSPVGIEIANSSGGVNLDFNSVHLSGAFAGLTTGASISAPLYITSANGNLNIRNNVFSNTYDNTTSSSDICYSIYSAVPNTNFVNINNNSFFASSGGTAVNVLGFLGSNQTNLAGIQSAFGQNLNSVNILPVFTSSTNLRINSAAPANVIFDNLGSPIAGITNDIDIQSRNALTPDIGAHEFTATAICTGANGGIISSTSFTQCSNQALTLSSSGVSSGVGTIYQWQVSPVSAGTYSNVIGGSGNNTPSFSTPSLAAGVYYYVLRATCGGSTAISNEAVVTINAAPSPSIIASNSVSCLGGNATTLTALGAVNYTWNTGATTNSIVITPTGSAFYNVTGGNTACANAASSDFPLFFSLSPTITAVSATSVICSGIPATLTASGANTYSWDYGAAGSIVNPLPNVSTTYTVTGAFVNGCNSSATVSVNVNPSPVMNISGSSGICTGQNASLTASGADTYTWSTNFIGSSIVVTPTTNTTYSVTGTNLIGCSSSTTQLVTVAASLSITIAGTPSICVGQTAILSGVGGVTYSWSTGQTTPTIAVNPSTSTTYSIIGSSGTCSNSGSRILTVNPNPTVSVTGGTVICVGQSASLTANGGITYTWNTNSNATVLVVSPAVNTTYTLTGSNGFGCTDVTTRSIVTNSVPIISVSQSAASVCFSTTASFTASGASTYTWVNGPQTPTAAYTPTATAIYTVSGTNPAGCVASATTNVAVNALPNVVITPTAAAVCANANLPLIASGAISYTWNGNNTITTAAVSFTPLTSTVYTVEGTNANGCVNSKTIAVTTNSLPVMAFTPSAATVCAQSAVSFTVSGANTYFWNNNNNTTTSSTFFPSNNSTYTVTGTSPLGCVSTATVMATALPLPAVTVSPSFTTVCEGSTSTFTASGAATYTWNNNTALTGSTQAISTPSASSYTIAGTGTNGCIGSSQFVVVTNALPAITITASTPTVCSLQPVQLVSSGATTFTWSSGVVNDTTVVNPVNNTTYSVSGTNTITGCTGTQTISVGTVSLPAIAISPASPTVCVKTPVTLTASGGVSYSWSNGPSSTAIAVTPTANISYTLTGTDAIGCTNIATVTVITNPLPVILVTPPSLTVCEGETANFVASGANTYTWSVNGSTSATLSIIPTFATFYFVTGIDVNNCKSSGSATINVSPCTGISAQQLREAAVTVFPNPSTGFFTARFEFEGEKTIIISNSMGQLVTQTVTANLSQDFDLSHLAKGVYFVKVSSKQASGNYKIVID
jgi:trimeric autotransporter adhesin